MQLNKQQAVELNAAMNAQGLKAKHVGAENFMTIITEKVKLKKALDTVIEKEVEVARQTGGDVFNGQAVSFPNTQARQDFNKLITPFYDEFSVEIKTHFIPLEELKEYVKEQDTETAAILFEYLLKT